VPSQVKERSPKALIFLSLFNSVLGLSILFPILAPLGRKLGLRELEVGWLSTGYAMMQFIASPLWGRYSERVGRKPVLLVGVFGFAIGFASFATAVELGQRQILTGTALFISLLGSRVLGGFLSSATMPSAQAYIADITDRKNRTSGMALIGAAFGLGIVFGPGLGAGLSHFGLLVPVYVSTVVALLNGLFVWLRVPEPVRRADRGTFSPSFGVLLRVWPVLGVGFVVTLAAVSMEQTVAFLFQDVLHLDALGAARNVGIALVSYGVSSVLAQGLFVRKVKWPPLTLILVGVPFGVLGFLGLALFSGMLGLTAALALQGFGQGLVLPAISAALSLDVSESEQGEVAGLNSAAQALGRTLGPVIGTALYGFHLRAPYQLSVALLVTVFVVVLVSPGLRLRVSGTRLSH
jgi:MFS family permease